MSSAYSRGQAGNTQAQSAPFVITLTMRRGPEPGRKFVISKERVTLGRLPTVEVSIEHRQISPRHASIVREKDRFVLSDLGSTNGTSVNDARLTGSCLLRNGDIIGLGDVELLFQVSGGAPAASPLPPAGVQAAAGPQPRPAHWERPLVAPSSPAKTPAKPRWPVFVVAGCAMAAVVICLAAAVAFFTIRQLPVFAAAPELTVIGPTSGIEVRAGQPVRVVASARDPRGVTKAEVWVRGELDSTIESDVPGGQRLLRVEQPWTPSGAGEYDIQIKVYNSAGKVSESQPIPITVLEDNASQPTVVAQAATATPAATPVVVQAAGPTATPPPAQAAATAPPAENCANDDATFVADVTVPDNAPFQRGAGFSKTWRIRNSGGCAWSDKYNLSFVSGNQMNAPDSQPVAATAAGGSVDVTVNMKAPGEYGGYSGVWQMTNPRGERIGHTFTVVIQVPSPATATPIPQPTDTPAPVQAISLRADSETVKGGECTTVHASADGVAAAWLDGKPIVGGRADKQICPCSATTVVLDVKMPNDEMKQQTLTINVDGNCIGTLPDLVVRDFNADPAEFKLSDSVHFRVRIKNQGGVDAKGFDLDWKPYGEDDYTETMSNLELEAGKDKWIEWDHKKWDPDKTGEFESRVIVDPDGNVKEADEGNNEKTRTITINN